MDAQPVREAELIERGGRIRALKRQIETAGPDQLPDLRRRLRQELSDLRKLTRKAQPKLNLFPETDHDRTD